MALSRKKCTLVQTISHVVLNLSWRSAIMSFLGAIKTPPAWALCSFLIQVRTSSNCFILYREEVVLWGAVVAR